jgi:manganese-dependent inorganic pyrophosphatase
VKNIIYINGHKNPDTDSICAAISYAEFKNKTGKTLAIPIRLGEINRETQFILNYFNVDEPELVTTVKTQISDLDIDVAAPISSDISLKMAWSIMKKNNIRTLPVIDENDRLAGIVSVSNLASNYLDIWDNSILSKSNTPLENILDTLSAKCVFKPQQTFKITGKIIVAAMNPDSTKSVIEAGDIAICGDREDSQCLIISSKACLLVITGNHPPTDDVIKLAKANDCTIILTPYDTFTASRLITQSIPINHVMSKKNIISFNCDDFIDEIKSIMIETRYRSYPVIDDNDRLAGVASVSNLASSYLDVWDNCILAKSNTTLENILDTLSAKCVFKPEKTFKKTGKVIVAAMNPESTKAVIEAGDIAICGDREDSQCLIISSKACLLIITGNHPPTDEVINLAKSNDCTIILTPYDTFTASRLITQSIPVDYVMTKKDVLSFNTEDFIEDIKYIMLETRYRSYPVIDDNNKVIGSVSRYHLISQNRKKVILMDHNERTQSVPGLEDAEILEIIDHHRIADVQTGLPIYFRNEPVGSTSTIVASIFFENGIRPSKSAAGLLCAAIISDTLLLKSPTSTLVDEIILKRLAQIANLNLEEFAKEMFKAGTSLEGKTAQEIFYQDFKTFSLNNFKVGVSQVGTMYIEGFDPLKEDIINLMNKKAKESSYDLVLLMLTDILNGGSVLIAAGEHKDVISKAFNVTLTNNGVYLPGIVSRKKQVIPPIAAAINQIK